MSMTRTRMVRSRRMPIAWLAIIRGKGRGRDFRLAEVSNIGRDGSQNDIVLGDETVSACHARIRLEDGAYYLYDLASTNRTLVNGQIVDRALIQDGDKITVGETTLILKVA